MNKRKFIRKKRNQLKLVIVILIIGSFGAGLGFYALVNFIYGEFSRYGDDALAMALINAIFGFVYISPIICSYEFCKELWKKGNRKINKIAKDILDD